MKYGILDIGGGLRSIYASGVFDACLDMHIEFDLCIGVSAGSGNMCAFLADYRKMSYGYYVNDSFDKQFTSIQNYFRTGSFLNTDYIYKNLNKFHNSIEETGYVDYEWLINKKTEFLIVATDVQTGRPRYFHKHDLIKYGYKLLSASSALPVFCQPVALGSRLYCDGAVGAPIPINKMFACGMDKIIVILNLPIGEVPEAGLNRPASLYLRYKYPKVSKMLALRETFYRRNIKKLVNYAAEGKALILSPDDLCGVGTVKKNKKSLNRLYKKGYQDAEAIKRFMSEQ